MIPPRAAGDAPWLTIILADREDSLFSLGVLPSLAANHQTDADASEYEVIVVSRAVREAELALVLASLGVSARLVAAAHPAEFVRAGAAAARGEIVLFVGEPGVASPTLVTSLSAAVATYPDAAVAVRTFSVGAQGKLMLKSVLDGDFGRWLALRGWPADASGLLRQANPDDEWLDPIREPANIAVRRSALRDRALPDSPRALTPRPTVQLLGDAFVRPEISGPPAAEPGTQATARPVDRNLRHFGLRLRNDAPTGKRPPGWTRTDVPKLSVLLIVYDMPREAPRTVQSLLAGYQQGISESDYEILVIENGSNQRLSEREICALGKNVRYHYLQDPPPSPAHAINFGAAQAQGEVICIMIDGACLASPGVLASGLLPFRSFPRPVVSTRYFVLGWDLQRKTMLEGYDQRVEDELLARIEWPKDGYRLFEIASPLTFGGPTEHWLTAWFESNALFLHKSTFEEVGGCDERFDLPGGGLLNIDFFVKAAELPSAQPVQIIGEGVFHQIHGGITSNTPPEDALAKELAYKEQYEALRGRKVSSPVKSYFFTGRLESEAARVKMRG